MTATVEIYSIGKLASVVQHHVTEIRRACDALGIVPAYRINCVPHYSAQDCERLAAYFRQTNEARVEACNETRQG